MDQQARIDHIAGAMAEDSAVRGLFLGGSHGRGTADAYSDIDLIALVEPGDQAAVASRWRRCLEAIAPVVFWSERGRGSLLVNAVTEDWQRYDLHMLPPAGFSGRARDLLKPLVDPAGLYETLPATLPPRSPDPERVRYLINEFIRVLGLLRVGVGRGELFTATVGAGLLRDHLVSLLLEEVPLADRGGALHLGRLLPPERMRMLEALPFPRPDRAEVIAAHMAIARRFFPHARRIAASAGVAWPAAFEAATRRALEAAFGGEADMSWS